MNDGLKLISETFLFLLSIFSGVSKCLRERNEEIKNQSGVISVFDKDLSREILTPVVACCNM